MAAVLLAPSVLALPSLAPPVSVPTRDLVVDFSDGLSDAEAGHLIRAPGTSAADLVRAAAAQMGYRRLDVPALPPLPAEMPLAAALATLYQVSNTSYDPAELKVAVATVDPRVQAPTARIVLALAEVGRLQQAATATLTLDDQWALVNALHHDQWGAEWRAAADKVRVDLLAVGAVLLLETIDGAVPELQAAATAGAWPPGGFIDPAGLIHLGTEGGDEYRSRRWLYLDPGGDDVYTDLCNSGGADPQSDVLIYRWTPILAAASIDLGGDDTHRRSLSSPLAIQGVGGASTGVLWDETGTDDFVYGYQGSGFTGVGVLNDRTGNDRREPSGFGAGHGRRGVGILLDVAGDDTTFQSSASIGTAADRGVGIYKDEGGRDAYSTETTGAFGWTLDYTPPLSSNATFTDLGSQVDSYPTWSPNIPAGNNKDWRDGRGGSGRDS